MPTDALTPDARERVEDVRMDLERAALDDYASERHERTARRQDLLDARAALLATVAALVSEAVAAERGRWEARITNTEATPTCVLCESAPGDCHFIKAPHVPICQACIEGAALVEP